MDASRFEIVTAGYQNLRIAIVGDFCLDRYLEIDPGRAESSIETGLPVYNVVNVRSQPGGAGTILNNLVSLGVREVYPVGFCGADGEGFELRRALEGCRGVKLDYFLQTPERRTFTYCKPLVVEPGKPPRELNRLDSKNWTETPPAVSERIGAAVRAVSARVDAIVLLDQADVIETGVVTKSVLTEIATLAESRPEFLIVADSRRSLRDFPPVCFKMNAAELAAMRGVPASASVEQLQAMAADLAYEQRRSVFVTLSERGIVGAFPGGAGEHAGALPLRGPIDVVGAGDAVTANLVAALASGASLREALEIAMAAASIVVHQLGTTGTATVEQLRATLLP
jgi:rfaE bifunctional protein kinase chain/domain